MEEFKMTFEKVKEILSKQLEVSVDEIQLANSLQEDLGADSLDVVEIVMALEDEFSIEIADEETAKIKTVDDIVKYIDSQK
jgi:acyl carrier protein